MSRRPSTAAALVALLAIVAAACTGGEDEPSPTPEPIPVKVAFLHDLSVPGSAQSVAPALLGLQLALEQAAERGDLRVVPEVVGLDVEGDDAVAVDLAHEVVDDPSYVAVVIGPFWSEPVAVGDVLDAGGVATLSLSGLDPTLASNGWSSWRRLVGGVAREAASLSSAIRVAARSVSGTCLVGDGTGFSDALGALVATNLGAERVVMSVDLPGEDALASVVADVAGTGCGTVAWTGFGPGAALLRAGLSEGGLGAVSLVGASAMKTESYLATTVGAGDGTIATCTCVDLSTSTRPEARRFIHDFQSAFGSAPGTFGAEGWDAGGMLLTTFRAGAADREAVAGILGSADDVDGLANTYRFDQDGELAASSAGAHVFEAEGVRWVTVGGREGEEALPVGTPGYLSVAACRKGRPHAYPVGDRLEGFSVELSTAIARRLGLTLSWRDLPCRRAIRAIADGRLDAALVPARDVPQGTLTSGIALATHIALVAVDRDAPEPGAGGDGPTLLERLGPHDLVTVVRTPEAVAWSGDVLASTGAQIRISDDRRGAYEALVAGTISAVADLEPDAWLAIERRPTLRVVQSIDAGIADVFVADGPDARVVAAIDEALARLIRVGRYGLLFAKYFPGTPMPPETGT